MLTFQPINFCDGIDYSPTGQKKKVEGLAVRITANCDNSCTFCIASEDMKNKRHVNIPKMIETVLNSGAESLEILGGEPLLFLDNCIQLLEGVRHQVKYVRFISSIPYTLISQWEKFEHIMNMPELGILHTSIQSTNWKVNNQLLNAKRNFDRISVLKKIAENYPDKLMVVLNLVTGGVDNKGKLYESLDDLHAMGVKKVRINELQKSGNQYVNFENISGINMPSPYAHGCKTPIKIYEGLEIIVKRACFMVEETLTATEEDAAKMEDKYLNPQKYAWQENNVCYEDGSLSEYWEEARDVFTTEPSCGTDPQGDGDLKPVFLGIPTIKTLN